MSKSWTFVGAVSFEDRCVGALQALVNTGGSLTAAHFLDLPTEARPVDDDLIARGLHREVLHKAAAEGGAREPVLYDDFPAYAGAPIRRFFRGILASAAEDGSGVVFDLTCLTRVQAVALATVLAGEATLTDIVIAYTRPSNYRLNLGQTGYADVLVMPLQASASASRLAEARGLLLMGHEGRRLQASLMEFEPLLGTVVIPQTTDRPDWRRLCLHRNADVLSYFEKESAAGEPGKSRWRVLDVESDDLQVMESLVTEEVRAAERASAPLMLYPYGPKLQAFVAAHTMARLYPSKSWCVYAVPSHYIVSSTEGIGRTSWIVRDEKNLTWGRNLGIIGAAPNEQS